MVGSPNNTAQQVSEEVLEEPSMEDILASIKQIISEDEPPEDGLSERERYEHPENPSNSNELNEIELGIEAALEAEMANTIADEAPVVAAAPIVEPVTRAEPLSTAEPVTMESRAAQVRAEISASGDNLSTDERLEKYRVRGKSSIEILAEREAAKAAAQPATVEPLPPMPNFTAAQPLPASAAMPATSVIANQLANKMMAEKSSEIEAMLGDVMRPIVRKWLGDNLPTMVEKLVKEEIQAVSRGRKTSQSFNA